MRVTVGLYMDAKNGTRLRNPGLGYRVLGFRV